MHERDSHRLVCQRHSFVNIYTINQYIGKYSCLRMTLYLQREFSYYLLQLYIPSLMLVSVSWVSFWLDKDSVPARVTLGTMTSSYIHLICMHANAIAGVTTLLTMTTQASGINAKLPP